MNVSEILKFFWLITHALFLCYPHLVLIFITFPLLLYLPTPSPSLSCPVLSSHRSTFERLPLTGESAVGSLLIIQPQRGRVTEGDALIVIGQLWTPAPPTCKRGQRSNKSSQAQRGGGGSGGVREGGGRMSEVEWGGWPCWNGINKIINDQLFLHFTTMYLT